LKFQNISFPFFSSFKIDSDLEWQMSRAEKYCLIEILRKINPEVAIEVGTYKGGSLQVLSKFSKTVHSIDISPEPKKFLNSKFNNVKFHVGDSNKLLDELISKIKLENKKIEFILIDGDHTKEGVKKDIKAIISHEFNNPLTIIIHDSFNPQCRKGIKSINYKLYKNIEHIDLDYITGCLSPNKDYNEMWGGFGIIVVNKKIKTNPKINASQESLFKKTYIGSKHFVKDKFLFLRPLKKFIYKKLNLNHKSNVYTDFKI
tara:strand:- start:237 stop:1013 length:777 start_codon:yes stop_codon:yes gene_type:complete